MRNSMLYSILIFGDEGHVAQWRPQEEQEVINRHSELRRELTAAGRLGPVIRLSPEGSKVVRRYKDRQQVTDGPYAETKEQLMGIYVIDCASFEDALAATERLRFETGSFEIRPLVLLDPGVVARRMEGSVPGCRPEGRAPGAER
jgi:hypothetical protein